MARSLKNPGIQGSGVWHPNILLPPPRFQGGGATGHQGLATAAGTPSPRLPLLRAGYQEPEGTDQHSFPAGHMPDWGARCSQGTYTRTHISCHPHPPLDLTITNPLFYLCGFPCSGCFVEMESYVLWRSVSYFSHLYGIWGLICFTGCVPAKV